jgi:hypothetical protein
MPAGSASSDRADRCARSRRLSDGAGIAALIALTADFPFRAIEFFGSAAVQAAHAGAKIR